MEEKLAIAQSLRYAEELRQLYAAERTQRRIAEDALALLEDSYRTTVRALAAALELRDDQTGAHAERVTELALRLAERVAPTLAADQAVRDRRSPQHGAPFSAEEERRRSGAGS